MTIFYNVVYLFLGVLLAPWMLWQRYVRGKRRAGWTAKFFGDVVIPPKKSDHPRLWLHAVSVGEVNLLAPLAAAIEREHSDWQCYLTVTTVAGYELATKKYPHWTVSYAPTDLSWAVKRALRIVQPDLLVLVELELWPNLIHLSTTANVPVVVINGRLSARSATGYGRLRLFLRPVFAELTHVAAQTVEYAERFHALGTLRERISVTGSLKFDGAKRDRGSAEVLALRTWAGIDDEYVVWLAGSTGEPEEEIVLGTYAELKPRFPSLKLIIAPRHPERFEHVAGLISAAGYSVLRRSRPMEAAAGNAIILVDVIGELADWWGTAHIGFVGGSLNNRGGQNMIEPAAFGVAVCFGPETRNFRDVVALLIARNAASVIRNGEELTQFIERCLVNPDWRTGLGRNAAQTAFEQLGAVEHTMRLLEHSLAERRS